jgi:hypothetical protein
MIRLFCMVWVVFFLGGCTDPAAETDAATMVALQEQFSAGNITLDCGVVCASTYGTARPVLIGAYQAADWPTLAREIIRIGENSDQSYYYLARAAEGMGYQAAARIYYQRALDAPDKCAGLYNNCDGIDVPHVATARVAALPAPANAAGVAGDAAAPKKPGPGDARPAIAVLTGTAPPGPEHAVRLVREGGVEEVPGMINGMIPLNFILDSGAADVSIPKDVAMTLYRTGTLTDADFRGTQTFQIADGTSVPSTMFIMHTLTVGDMTLHDVTASISSVEGPPLLGQTFLSRFKGWSLDNAGQMLVLK